MRVLPALAVLSLLVLLPNAAAVTVVASGSFKVGSPLAANSVDACVGRSWGTGDLQEGLDSNCFDIPAFARGQQARVLVEWEEDATGLAYLGHNLCFFDQSWTVSTCRDGSDFVIPSWAAHASMSATGGTNVRWTLYAMSI